MNKVKFAMAALLACQGLVLSSNAIAALRDIYLSRGKCISSSSA
ncbi:MAG: hypothetical protein ACLPTF_07925 [Steroidobacteraceae bacterium]